MHVRWTGRGYVGEVMYAAAMGLPELLDGCVHLLDGRMILL